jgi:hypothetical protein
MIALGDLGARPFLLQLERRQEEVHFVAADRVTTCALFVEVDRASLTPIANERLLWMPQAFQA